MYCEGKIDRFVLDEIHCVKSWGDTFRPSYSHLKTIKEKYPKVPILGLTATATLHVRADIARRIGLDKNFLVFQSSFNRPNITIKTEVRPNDKSEFYYKLQSTIERFSGEPGIIYCNSRADTKHTAKILKEMGVSCTHYHADLEKKERKNA